VSSRDFLLRIIERVFQRCKCECRCGRSCDELNAGNERRLWELTAENARLKRLLAERDLELDVLKEVLSKRYYLL
jgi:hypothetical protein